MLVRDNLAVLRGQRQSGRPGVWRGGQTPSGHAPLASSHPVPRVQASVFRPRRRRFTMSQVSRCKWVPRGFPSWSEGLRLPASLAWPTCVPHSASHICVALGGVPSQLSPAGSSRGPSQPIRLLPEKSRWCLLSEPGRRTLSWRGDLPSAVVASSVRCGSWAVLCLSLTTVTPLESSPPVVGTHGPSRPFCFLEFCVFVFAFSGFILPAVKAVGFCRWTVV